MSLTVLAASGPRDPEYARRNETHGGESNDETNES